MRICAFREYDAVATGVVVRGSDAGKPGAAASGGVGDRVVGLDDLNDRLGMDFGPDLDALLRRGQADALREAVASVGVPQSGWRASNLRYAPPIARPPKIWGVGLNFQAHATELAAEVGEDPVAWMRPATTLAGDGAQIHLPEGVGKVTAEAEIAVVLGKRARALETREAARDAVFGFTPVLDLTAEELLRRNVRNLTRAKSYDGFCVVGPFVTTVDEWEPTPETRVSTEVDKERREGRVAQMRHDPYELVRFFSHVFPWEPGDLLLTGTPGALPLAAGSAMRATVEGLGTLGARVA